MTALRLHAITLSEAHRAALAVNGDKPPSLPTPTGTYAVPGVPTTLIPFRDLCAVVSEQKAFALDEVSADVVTSHRAIVDAIFRRAAVLPAPVGVVFRAPDVLTRWMELHYVSLTSALDYVDDRAVARVHITRSDNTGEPLEEGSELAAVANESVRALRRVAVAAITVHGDPSASSLSVAFLVERETWKEFTRGVKDQSDAHHLLHFETTGPWAPYDFVRMQFGG
ncbi:MAG: GvpL/GvpF family gas vesicle protein [bacterium]